MGNTAIINPDLHPNNDKDARTKRSVAAAFGAVAGGVGSLLSGIGSIGNLIINHGLKDKVRKIGKLAETNSESIKFIHSDMIMLAQTTNGRLVDLHREIQLNSRDIGRTMWKLDRLTAEVLISDELLDDKIRQNSDAIKLLSMLTATLQGQLERNMLTYQRYLLELDSFLIALDNLSEGLLTHHAVSTSVMNRLITGMRDEIRDRHLDYDLVMTSVQEYYDMPLVSFTYTQGIIVLHIPIYLKQTAQKPLTLYNIKTVPVPYKVAKHTETFQYANARDQDHHVLSDDNEISHEKLEDVETTAVYTKIVQTYQMIAINDVSFITLDEPDLVNCVHFRKFYLCENVFLLQHKTQHNCESAIYWDESNDVIYHECKFEYLHDYTPKPSILDAGDKILLAGLPLPWTFYCKNDQLMPEPLQGEAYVVIERKELCKCSINAGYLYIQESLISCSEEKSLLAPDQVDQSTNFQLGYPVNMAVVINFPELYKDLSYIPNDTLVLSEPLQISPDFLEIIRTQEDDVMPTTHVFKAPLKDVVEKIKAHQKIHATKGDKALRMDDIDKWAKGENKTFAFVLAACVLGILTSIVTVYLGYKVCSLRQGMVKFNGLIPRLLSVIPLSTPGHALTIIDDTVQVDLKTELYYLILVYVAICVLAYLVYKAMVFGYNWLRTKWIYNPNHVAAYYPSYLFEDKTDICMEVTNFGSKGTVSLYLGTVIEYPSDMYVTNPEQIDEFLWDRSLWRDSIAVNWKECRVLLNKESLKEFSLPYLIKIPLLSRCTFRTILEIDQPIFRLLAIHGSIMSMLTPFQKIKFREKTDKDEFAMKDVGHTNHVYNDVLPNISEPIRTEPTAPEPPARLYPVVPKPEPETVDTKF